MDLKISYNTDEKRTIKCLLDEERNAIKNAYLLNCIKKDAATRLLLIISHDCSCWNKNLFVIWGELPFNDHLKLFISSYVLD